MTAVVKAGLEMQAGLSEEVQQHSKQAPRLAPVSQLPRTQFLSIEYPGVLRPHANEEEKTLANALKTLAPGPPEFASPVAALKHLARIVDAHGNFVECRLSPSTSGCEEVFRHALQGEVQPSHNVVLRIKKRTWRKKKKSPTGEQQVCREYTVSAAGVVRHVARFKTMADYLYDPGLRRASSSSSSSSAALEQERDSVALRLLEDVCKMDAEALLQFDLPGERADPSRPIFMAPPPQFARRDAPLNYGFRQNPSSHLVAYGPVQSDGSRAMRYEHRLRDVNTYPAQFSMGARTTRSKVPTDSKTAKGAKSRGVDERLVNALKQRFEERPMWMRTGLLNQFSQADRKTLLSFKQHIAECCYSITNGCWRDCLVRFSYDPRESRESRFFQRVSFQGKGKRIGAVAATASPSKDTRRNKSSGEMMEMDQKGSSTGVAGASDNSEEDNANDRVISDDSHIFDGVTLNPSLNSFMLIDITDELVRPLIDATGPQALRDKVDLTTGWYTAEQWEKIRTVLQLRFHSLADFGIPAAPEKCAAAIALVEARFRDAETKGSRQDNRGGEDDHDDEEEEDGDDDDDDRMSE